MVVIWYTAHKHSFSAINYNDFWSASLCALWWIFFYLYQSCMDRFLGVRFVTIMIHSAEGLLGNAFAFLGVSAWYMRLMSNSRLSWWRHQAGVETLLARDNLTCTTIVLSYAGAPLIWNPVEKFNVDLNTALQWVSVLYDGIETNLKNIIIFWVQVEAFCYW